MESMIALYTSSAAALRESVQWGAFWINECMHAVRSLKANIRFGDPNISVKLRSDSYMFGRSRQHSSSLTVMRLSVSV